MIKNAEFNPDWHSPPGDTLLDILAERGLTAKEFARQIETTDQYASELLSGRAMLTLNTARKLKETIGASTSFWMLREAQYRNSYARKQSKTNHAKGLTWLKALPVRDMIKFGWIKNIAPTQGKIEACLRFFGAPDIPSWQATYRTFLEGQVAFRTSRTFDSHPGATAAWLRKGELEADEIYCQTWSAKRLKEALPAIRALTRIKHPSVFLPTLQNICAGCGVAVAVVRAPTGCRASGATRFVSSNKALLLLSFRHLSDDHFWFSFFHETGHLVLHGKDSLFLEGVRDLTSKEEDEADEFASQSLIPPQFKEAILSVPIQDREIIRVARAIGISPGIVVGQLQHMGRLRPNQLNWLKRRFRWKET